MGGSSSKPENALDLRKLVAGVLVTVIGGVLLKLSSEGIERWNSARAAPSPTAAETGEPASVAAEQAPGPTPSPTPSSRVFDFTACPLPCNVSNATTSFPDGTEVIYSRWNYAGIPFGSHYVRTWTMDGMDWVRYDCEWQGPPAGMSEVELREPMGFHSGNWVVTISVDGQVLLEETIQIEGNHTYWDPAGMFPTCYEE